MEADIGFVRRLCRGGTELRFLSKEKGARRSFGAETWPADLAEGRDCYFRVVPPDRAESHVLWVDIDFKRTPEEDAVGRLAALPEPHAVVRSGNGLHVYWLVDPPIPVSMLKPMLRSIAQRVGGDPSSAEPSRILRVPGTMNLKYDPPRECRLVKDGLGDLPWDPRDLCGELTKELSNAPPSPSVSGGGRQKPSEAALSKARSFVDHRAPAVEGQRGDEWTLKTAMYLARNLGLSDEQAMPLLLEWDEWNEPPWGEDGLREKLRNAREYGSGEIGADDPALDFAEVAGEVAWEPPSADFGALDQEFFLATEAGQLRVLHHQMRDDLGRRVWVRYKPWEFAQMTTTILQMPRVKVPNASGKGAVEIHAGSYWMDYRPDTRRYTDVVFMPEHGPGGVPGGAFNLWRGFAVEESDGGWGMLKRTMLEVLCSGDRDDYEYLMGWLALSVQRPEAPAGTAVVLRGPKGVGKGVLGRAWVRLFGAHGMQVTSPESLTGRFNLHMQDVVALFADEAFWAGDKSGESRLKGLITEPLTLYEGKGMNQGVGRNCLHVLMASNSDWVVPAGMDHERRFAVMQVDQGEPRGAAWFDEVYRELEAGGYGGMLRELRRRDLGGFDARRVPRNRALAEQKLMTMDIFQTTLWEMAGDGWRGMDQIRPGVVTCAEFRNAYLGRAGIKAADVRSTETMIGMRLPKYLPSVKKAQMMVKGTKVWVYKLPEAEDAVNQLAKKLGLDGRGTMEEDAGA